MTEELINTTEAAEIAGRSAANITWLIRRGKLDATITAIGYEIKREDLEQYLKTRKPFSERIAEANSKSWIIIDPSGHTQTIRNLSKFCRDHDLSYKAMQQVASGTLSQHKGWKCRVLEDEGSATDETQ